MGRMKALGAVTNETVTIGTNTLTQVSAYDGFHRLASLTAENGAFHFIYDVESRLSAISNAAFAAAYAYTPDGLDAGWTVACTNGTIISRVLTHDAYRRSLIKTITNSVNGVPVNPLTFSFDALNRVISRNVDTFAYNARSEVTSAFIDTNDYAYAYDNIGNCASFAISAPLRETFYTANALNQYTSILCAPAPLREPAYDPDGNLLALRSLGEGGTNGVWSYTWDAENCMTGAASNGVPVVTSSYEPQHRRVVKTTPSGKTIFLYDGWLPVLEEFIRADGTNEVREHVWGKDLSGTMQGAGGVGGLLATCIGGAWYFPLYDMNGNVTDYFNDTGTNVAHREYDAFGNTVAKSGPMDDDFNFWFSSKYLDHETSFYYYGYRLCSPELMRWLNRDPIEEAGGQNLYTFVLNNPINSVDPFGEMPLWMEKTAKELGYQAWRAIVITKQHWREVMDAWYYEAGLQPVTYSGIGDPRNHDISTNPGFKKLLDCWIAKKRGESVPAGAWSVTDTGIQWSYTYSRTDAAGGAGAYRCETEFLGTYAANVTALGSSAGGKCRYKIHAWNTSGWSSGTRLPGLMANALRKLGWSGTSIFYDHDRGASPYTPSRGGNLDQNYDFETEADCCAKCVLP